MRDGENIQQYLHRRLKEETSWHPIASAPKDGTPILAYEHDWGYPISIRWHQPGQTWVLNGVLLKLGDWGEPEIWQPLPEPPTA